MRKVGAFVLSVATLALETALIRVFALAQGYHFAFMSISVALLGLGAGGALLAFRPRAIYAPSHRIRDDASTGSLRQYQPDLAGIVLVLASVGFSVVALGGYIASNRLPLDVYRIAWERAQVFYLLLYYLLLALPFLFTGVTIGLLLEMADAGNVIYAANLLGSAAGSLLGLVSLARVGGPSTVVLSAQAGWVAAGLFAASLSHGRRLFRWIAVLLGAFLAVWVSRAVSHQPRLIDIRLSPYRALSSVLRYPDARLVFSQWNAFSRVDVVESGAIHVSPGLSLAYSGVIPPQRGIFVDAHGQAPMLASTDPGDVSWASHLPIALPLLLRPRAEVLVLEPGGGLDVAAARLLGAGRITAVSSNPLVVSAVQDFASGLYDAPDVRAVVESPRSFASRVRRGEQELFQIVDLALNDAHQTVVSGAYILSEDYRYTTQAFSDYLDLLPPGGLFVVQRWLQTPPSESLRAWALAVEALEQDRAAPLPESVIAIRSWSTMLILVKKGAFTAAELEAVRAFCVARHFDLVYLPGLEAQEANRYNVYPGAPYYMAFQGLLSAERRESFYQEQEFSVRPPRDDWPFFFHFFKWRQVPQILQSLGHTWEPFGGGGYLILVSLLAIATVTSVLLILLPAAFARGRPDEGLLPRWSILLYFGALGVAYLAVEIPLLQRFVLLVDHPTIAFATVVSALLVFSGLGSLLAPRLGITWVIPVLVVYLLLLLYALPVLFDLLLGLSLATRVGTTVAILAPLGLLMGVPFAAGLAIMRRLAPTMISWAYGINGCASVIASVGTAMLALSGGFTAVMAVGAAAYLVAWGVVLWANRVASSSYAAERSARDRSLIRL